MYTVNTFISTISTNYTEKWNKNVLFFGPINSQYLIFCVFSTRKGKGKIFYFSLFWDFFRSQYSLKFTDILNKRTVLQYYHNDNFLLFYSTVQLYLYRTGTNRERKEFFLQSYCIILNNCAVSVSVMIYYYIHTYSKYSVLHMDILTYVLRNVFGIESRHEDSKNSELEHSHTSIELLSSQGGTYVRRMLVR